IVLMDQRVASFPDMNEYIPSETALPTSMKQPTDGGHASFLETSVGLALATLHLILHMRRSPEGQSPPPSVAWNPCIALVQDALKVALDEQVDEDDCEVLYGRAGLLYAMMLLRSEIDNPGTALEHPVVEAARSLVDDASMAALLENIVRRGEMGARNYAETLSGDDNKHAPPLMWSWHGKRYIGGAHGVVGILHMMSSVPDHLLKQYWAIVLDTLTWLVKIQQPSGNWTSRAGRHMHDGEDEDERHQLVQWCHGAPGVLLLMSKIIRRFSAPSDHIPADLLKALYASISRGGELVYSRGFLRKGVGLCHGVAGSVYALLSVSEVLDTDDEKLWLKRAVHLAQLATQYSELESSGEMSVPDFPYSLYGGVAGMCCAWADVLRVLNGEEAIGFPAYDDLRRFQ
ncbi:hypothetical protein EIP91_000796, partial [Steccherinum ochraceum]